MVFEVEGPEDAQITVELESETEYEIMMSGLCVGRMKTNLGGKLSFHVQLSDTQEVEVKIIKC